MLGIIGLLSVSRKQNSYGIKEIWVVSFFHLINTKINSNVSLNCSKKLLNYYITEIEGIPTIACPKVFGTGLFMAYLVFKCILVFYKGMVHPVYMHSRCNFKFSDNRVLNYVFLALCKRQPISNWLHHSILRLGSD